MPDYEHLYYYLFNAITKALGLMSGQNFGFAEECLKDAQQEAEEIYITSSLQET